jgi:hypothetical protein
VEAFLLHGGTSISWKTHHVAKGLVPAAIGPGGGRVKLNSAREGTGGGDFLDLNISQTVGGNQEQTPITN